MSAIIRQLVFCTAGLLPLVAFAQTAPAPASSTGMDMMAMPGMEQHHDGSARHAGHRKPKRAHVPAKAAMHHHAEDQDAPPAVMAMPMPMMGHAGHASDAMPAMEHAAMPAHAMQDGMAPPDARSSDYSDGIGQAGMSGMDMRDAEPLGMLRLDQLEAFHGPDGNGQRWDLQAWYGTDIDRLWLRSEGVRENGSPSDGDVAALWSHAVAPYWDAQLGVRHDFGDGPGRDWAAFGVQGLAPYWFELAATAYAGPSGRTAARLRVEYEWLFTQRLILQPEFELNAYGRSDPARHLGSGLSDAQFGLRLRYEIRRQFAPYLGVVWTRRFGGTADFARDNHQPIFDRQWVAGARIWF
ncbi:MAG TPA: copper resistance protein B [Rhodanobacter sp.]|nr:copper resistance protein B [Rhodanobacter sp.]